LYVLFLSLFSYSCGDHPALHSFPTRRSSDLSGEQSQGCRQVPQRCERCFPGRVCPRKRADHCSRKSAENHHAPVRRCQGNRVAQDRKSTRLNSSHVKISYAVFCLKKKKQTTN